MITYGAGYITEFLYNVKVFFSIPQLDFIVVSASKFSDDLFFANVAESMKFNVE